MGFSTGWQAAGVPVAREEGVRRAPWGGMEVRREGCVGGRPGKSVSGRDRGRRRSKQRLWHAAHAGLVAMEAALGGVGHGPIGFLGVSRRMRMRWPS
jgi:hypothetical protein